MNKITNQFDEITEQIVIGRFPGTKSDLDDIVTKANCQAILCLQSDQDLEELELDWYQLQTTAETDYNLHMTRVPMKDFDAKDQAAVLGEAVYTLNSMLDEGKRVYVHCTAGMNRSPLVVLAYLTFVKRMSLDEAHQLMLAQRKVAAPPIDVWRIARRKLLERHTDRISEILGSDNTNQELRVAAEKDVLSQIFLPKAKTHTD